LPAGTSRAGISAISFESEVIKPHVSQTPEKAETVPAFHPRKPLPNRLQCGTALECREGRGTNRTR